MLNKQTPFYEFDEDGFIENYRHLEKAMKDVYSNYKISYSYKTNYTPYICQLVKKMGGYAEVVSDMEYSLAKKIGYSNDKIIYNGPAKGPLLEEHLLNDGIVNIDNYYEAKEIVNLSKKNNKLFCVGIRINVDVGGNFISRFGLEGNELEETVNFLKSNGIKIIGLHCHISRNRGLEAWIKRAEIMISMADRYIDGIPKYISLGSGMFADMARELKEQFDNVPSYEEYANAVMSQFEKKYANDKPIIFTEPGTTLVARYISLYTKVISIKTVRGRVLANTDGSFEQLGEICQMKKLPISVLNRNGDYYDSIDIMGYTCLEQDLMYEAYKGNLSVGSIIRFDNVGGYSIVSKPQFIKPNCAMYVNDNMIMRPETFNDVFDKFKF